MKKSFLIIIIIIANVFVFETIGQSKLMPLPNGYAMDFQDCPDATYYELPKSTLLQGSYDPLDESDLCNNFSNNVELLDDNYIGQYPKYCQQTIHDERGNLLFFIVDNNIYNNEGRGFENPNTGLPYLLHDFSGYGYNEITRFYSEYILRTEVIIVPVPSSCDNSFYVFYTLSNASHDYNYCNQTVGGTNPARDFLYCKVITYFDKDNITMSTPYLIMDSWDLFGQPTPLSEKHHLNNLAITDYRPNYNNYLLFYQISDLLMILPIGGNPNSFVYQNAKISVDNTVDPNSILGWQYNFIPTYSELEVIKHPGQDYYLTCLPVQQNWIRLIGIPTDFNAIPGNIHMGDNSNILVTTYNSFPFIKYAYDDLSNGNQDHFKGLELTSDCNYLYLTQQEVNGIKMYDITNDDFYYLDAPNNEKFFWSHMEMGKDGNIYLADFIGTDPDPNSYEEAPGKLAYISNPETPVITSSNTISNTMLTVTNIDVVGTMGGDNSGTFIFPDQVDNYDYSTFFINQDNRLFVDNFPTTFNPTEVWSPGCNNNPFGSIDGHVYIEKDAVIPKGVTIEMQNMVFHFKEGASLTLEAGDATDNGAYLKLDNTKLTNYIVCDYYFLWDGVILEGNNSIQGLPSSSEQPYVKIYNQSIIENALIGVQAKDGGIVRCYDSEFINNKQSFVFTPYQNYLSNGNMKANESEFSNCNFSVNIDYLGNSSDPFKEHIYFDNVDGITIVKSHFENTVEQEYNKEGNYGINSNNAGFLVAGSCGISLPPGQPCPENDLTRTSFDGFSHGIHIKGSKADKLIRIETCLFNNNYYGVQINSYDHTEILRNKFNVGNSNMVDNTNNPPRAIGLLNNASTGFRIEENIFYGFANSNGYETVGAVAEGTGENNNEIYLNDFYDLDYGINPIGYNRDMGNSYIGLQLTCNNFNNLLQSDIYINIGPIPQTSDGIRDFQGNTQFDISAGNCFSITNQAPEAHIKSLVQPILAYYYSGIIDITNCDYPNKVTPLKVARFEVNPNSCPSHLSDGDRLPLDQPRESQVISDYNSAETQYYNLLYSYLQQIDGGSTPALLTEIQNSWSQAAVELRNHLMTIAPFVTQDALIEAANTGILPDALLLEVCLANPDATRSDELIDIIKNDIPNPLPLYMIDMIQANWNTETSRTLLENGLAYFGGIRDRKCDLLIANVKAKNDFSYNDLRYWHEQRNNLNDRYSIIDLYLIEGDYTNANNVLNDIPVDFNLNDWQQNVYNKYTDYYNIISVVLSSGRDFNELTQTEQDNLEIIANSTFDFVSAKAQNILCTYYNICYNHKENVEDPNKSTESNQFFSKNKRDEYAVVYVNPNPATSYVNFNWKIEIPTTNPYLIITDVKGNIVLKKQIHHANDKYVWKLKNVNSGTYIYNIKDQNKILASGKLIIE